MMQFNKMFVMLPVMFLARKLDGEDPVVVYWLRVAYAGMQVVCVAAVAYTYWQAAQVKADRVVYVPAPAVPFADPNAKKKYTEIAFNAHVLQTARSLLGSTLFGIALTVGLHFYKGMVMGLAIQTVMGPLNLIENPLIKALFLSSSSSSTGSPFTVERRIFEEKVLADLTPDDEVVDEQGNPVVRRGMANSSTTTAVAGNKSSTTATTTNNKTLEEIMLDTWDAGSKADIGPLMAALTKTNCNFQTAEDHWTPLMILAGLGSQGTAGGIATLLHELGANPALCDKEGWNAMHWAAFHGSEEGAKAMMQENTTSNATVLLAVKDKDGLTPVETARKEGNATVAEILAATSDESKKSK